MIRIGTSGWHYPHWQGLFYPAGLRPDAMLRFYAGRFDTVEINNTHYRLPAPAVFDGWRLAVPPDFIFAVKVSRYLTHFHRLKPPYDRYARFFDGVRALGGKLGPLLFQLPPMFQRNDERLERFIGAIPPGFQAVFEFRHVSWEVPEVRAILARHGVGLCVTDLGGRLSPVAATGDLAYVRLHGPREAYRGSYADGTLADWRSRALAWAAEGHRVFIFFDNDDKALAVRDALRLKAMLGGRPLPPPALGQAGQPTIL